MKHYIQQVYNRPVVWLAALAALLYSSWPLAFFLNPDVVKHALESQLQTAGQPYNWVFIAGDALTGAVLLVAAALQYKVFITGGLVTRLGIIGYALFGGLVAIAALVPLNCDPQAKTCGPLIHDPFVLIHGFASIVSVLALLMGTLAVAIAAYKKHASAVVREVFLVLLAGWLIFGIGSIAQFWWHPGGNGMQNFFITLCSASIVAIVAAIEYMSLNNRDPRNNGVD
ncbi:MAG TPA: DUF998 domain-containing protein [Candidatus Saccharimonadales bacterium]